MCSAQYGCFCSSLTSCFPGMLLTYFLNDIEIVPVGPIITGITFVFTFHMCCIYIVRYLCFRIFSASILIKFLLFLLLIIIIITIHCRCRGFLLHLITLGRTPLDGRSAWRTDGSIGGSNNLSKNTRTGLNVP